MQKILFKALIILLGFNITVFSKDSSTINGSADLKGQEYNSLNVNGSLKFKDLVVKDMLTVSGSSQGKNLKCRILKSNGSFDIDGLHAHEVENNGSFTGEHIEITGSADFSGSLEITNGKLHDVKIASTHATINNTKVDGTIHIKKSNSGWSLFGFSDHKSSAQILELKGNSFVSGDIIFEETGEIHLFDDAKVKGKIVNAKVVEVLRSCLKSTSYDQIKYSRL